MPIKSQVGYYFRHVDDHKLIYIAAVKYLEGVPAGSTVDEAEFDKTCGVGALPFL